MRINIIIVHRSTITSLSLSPSLSRFSSLSFKRIFSYKLQVFLFRNNMPARPICAIASDNHIMAEEPPDVVSELRARLAVTGGLDEGEYVVVSQAPKKQPKKPDEQAASGPPVFLLRAGLKLRSGAEKDSELVGDGGIRAGTRVTIIESHTLPDGTERRCLALEGRTEPHGWVTAFSNDGQPNLLTEAEAQAAHAATLAMAVTGRSVPASPVRARSWVLSNRKRHAPLCLDD
jgi:hypothetical protein